jgi:CubicO group peptidase (beta-lactamase class C family)
MSTSHRDLQLSLEESIVRHQVPGASVAVVREGDVVTAAAGITNKNTGVEVTQDTVMHIGSITKVFNATLVMQLVDDGTVDLNERVLRYLPELRLKDRRALEQMTVQMLLNHTSGIDGRLLPDHGHDEETIEKGVARFADLGQIHEPGTEFSYNNAATVIAGYLVQRLAGKSWYQLVRERIFEPLNMEHAAALPEEALLHRSSVGHYLDSVSNQTLVRTSCAFLPLSFAPAGSTLMMSAGDLIAFARTHMAQGVGPNGARILSTRSAQSMQRMTVNNKGKGYTYTDGVGLGWMVSEDGLLHHSGGGPGIVSALYAYPEREFAAAVLTNAEHGLNLVNEWMEPWLKDVGTTKPIGMAEVRVPSEKVKIDSRRYVGVYEDLVNRFRVSLRPDGLALSNQAKFAGYESISTQETQPARLIPLGDERFLLEPGEKNEMHSFDEFRMFAFRNPDAEGRMRHLGNNQCLFRRQ